MGHTQFVIFLQGWCEPPPPTGLQNIENNGSDLGMAGKILSAWELQVKY